MSPKTWLKTPGCDIDFSRSVVIRPHKLGYALWDVLYKGQKPGIAHIWTLYSWQNYVDFTLGWLANLKDLWFVPKKLILLISCSRHLLHIKILCFVASALKINNVEPFDLAEMITIIRKWTLCQWLQPRKMEPYAKKNISCYHHKLGSNSMSKF